MASEFIRTDPYGLKDNVFQQIDQDWMLVTAGTPARWNTMTASWGGLGVLWNRPVSFVFVRPTRYTVEFMENNEAFTLSFFGPDYPRVLEFCGSHSGRHVNKMERSGLTPVKGSLEDVYFSEARLIDLLRIVRPSRFDFDLVPGANGQHGFQIRRVIPDVDVFRTALRV